MYDSPNLRQNHRPQKILEKIGVVRCRRVGFKSFTDQQMMDIIKGGVDQSPFVDTISMSASIDSEDIDFESWYGIQETRKQQREDPDISKTWTMKRKGESPKMTELTPGTRLYQLAKDFDRFMLKRGLLYRNTTTNGDCR